MGLAMRTVQRWGQRYKAEGLAEFYRAGPGRGRPPILSAEEQQLVVQRVEEGPQEEDVCSLRGLDFPKSIEEQSGKLMSLSAVYGLLHSLDYEWLIPRSKHRKSDPDAIAAFPESPGRTRPDSDRASAPAGRRLRSG